MLQSDYATASPFAHVVIDGFLLPDIAREAATRFPQLPSVKRSLARFLEDRAFDGHVERHDPVFAHIFAELHGTRFVAWLSALTGIAGLDPDRENIGAGLHQGVRGSYLRLHADHNTHPHDPSHYRRLNLLIYLNDPWDERWNGALELWDDRALNCVKTVEPVFNRCVIMEVGDRAFHGYGPLRTPAGHSRKAIVAYYYAPEPGAMQSTRAHPTIMPAIAKESLLTSNAHRVRRMLLHALSSLVKPN